jgi:hypothetical protein
MNIFVLSRNPWAAARMMCDQHVVKMILESAQMLNTNPIISDERRPRTATGEIYRQSHVNHPCSIWSRSSIHHTRWLAMHGMALCLEYRRRYNKTHALHFFFVEMLRFHNFRSAASDLVVPYYYHQSENNLEICRGLIRWGSIALMSNDKGFSDAVDSGIITDSDCLSTTARRTLTNDYWIRVVMTNEIGSRVLDYLSENPNMYFYDIDYVQAMPDEYKHSNPVTAYRNYYRAEKSKFARYSRGVDPPEWLADSL